MKSPLIEIALFVNGAGLFAIAAAILFASVTPHAVTLSGGSIRNHPLPVSVDLGSSSLSLDGTVGVTSDSFTVDTGITSLDVNLSSPVTGLDINLNQK
jgi:hypothetical protein